jgi:tetratricopeptide (TPR) repeat protein
MTPGTDDGGTAALPHGQMAELTLPSQQVQTTMTVQIGPQETVVIGESEPSADPNAPEEVLKRKIAASLREAMSKPAKEVAERLGAAKDCAEAVQVLKTTQSEGLLGFPPTRAILAALERFDLLKATKEDRRFLRQAKLEVAQALRDSDVVAREAGALLDENPGAFRPSEAARYEAAKAIGLARHGSPEAALAIWRRLLEAAEPPEPEFRGWLWRNIARTVGPKDASVKEAARHSVDAFLEAGDKQEALNSLSLLSDALMHESPDKAMRVMDEMVEIASDGDLVGRDMRAGVLHARANRQLAMGAFEAALADAKGAVELRRGLIGVEERLAGSLNLVAAALTGLGRLEDAEAYSEEADRLFEVEVGSHFAVVEEISSLLETFDRTAADHIEADARAQEKWEVVAAITVVRATRDPGLSTDQKLNLLERLLVELEQRDLPGKMTVVPRRAIAAILTESGQLGRAVGWLKKLIEDAPWERWAITNLASIYFQQEDWRSAVDILQADIQMRGERPGIFYFLGQAYLGLGEASLAVTALQRSFALAPEGSNLKDLARQLREKALDAGGTILPPKPKPMAAAVTGEEFAAALDEFAKHIAADQRKAFWRHEENERKWVSRPENVGRSLLHTFLKSKFCDRINVFRELDAGAGRLDVLVQLAGGLSIILELKMCGQPYSSTYAKEGEGQILHYMENRNIHLGYLIVFDARSRDFGNQLISPRTADSFIVREKFVDVRPEVIAKNGKV